MISCKILTNIIIFLVHEWYMYYILLHILSNAFHSYNYDVLTVDGKISLGIICTARMVKCAIFYERACPPRTFVNLIPEGTKRNFKIRELFQEND